MPKTHPEKWFLKQETRLEEPLKNTIRYKGKWAIFKLCTGVLAIWGIVQLVRLYKYLNDFSNFTTEYMRNGRAVTNDGAPGAGKTFTGCNTAYYLAQEAWKSLQSDYHIQRAMLSVWLKNGDTDKIEAFKAIEQSYE